VDAAASLLVAACEPGDPWWVDGETPPGAMIPPLRLALHGIAVATSGRYVRGEHNIDPRTGRAATGRAVATTVIAPSAMPADAMASAILVAFPTLTSDSVRRLPFRVVYDADAGCCEILADALRAMLGGEDAPS
jgi:thiamine biosynthesis lipoprotein